MYFKTIARAAFIFLFLTLLSACGDLSTVLPAYNTYQISALLNNSIQLEEYSLVRENDSLSPYCARAIVKDPDIRALQVVFQNSRKETLAGSVRYALNMPEPGVPDNDEQNYTVPDAYFPDAFFPLAEFSFDDSPDTGSEAEEEEAVIKETDETVLETEVPEEEQPPEETVQDELVRIGNDEFVFNVDRLDISLPAFALPENLGIGLYTMIIRVLGEHTVLDEVEVPFYYMRDAKLFLKDITMYLPGYSAESRLIPPGTTVLLEAKVDSDARLNPYIVWYNGKRVIKEGSLSEGAGFILWKASEQNGFQSLYAELFPGRNHEGIKGIRREIVLPVSAKAARANFFSVQTLVDFSETMPDAENDKDNEDKEDNDNTDDETEEPAAPVTASLSDIVHWYQFAATLKDSYNPLLGEIQPKSEQEPRWLPLTHSYGLSSGPLDVYELPPLAFVRKSEKQGGGLFLFRIKPASDGIILNARLASSGASGRLTMELLTKEGSLSLLLSTPEGGAAEISIPIGGNESNYPVITAALVFYIFPEYLEARLVTEQVPTASVSSTKIRVSGLLDGLCRIRLGKADANAVALAVANVAGNAEANAAGGIAVGDTDGNAADSAAEAENSGDGEQYEDQSKQGSIRNQPISAVWDQLAILYMTPPEAPEPLEPEIETAEEGAPAIAVSATVNTAITVAEDTAGQPVGTRSATEDAHTNSEAVEAEDEYLETVGGQTVSGEDEAEDADAPAIISVIIPEYLLTDVRDDL